MHKFFVSLFASLISISALAEDWLIIETTSKTIQAFNLQKKPHVYFNNKGDVMYVLSDGDPFFQVQQKDLSRFYFSSHSPEHPSTPDDEDNINELQDEADRHIFTFSYDGSFVRLTGVEKSTQISVYNIKGIKQSLDIERYDNNATIKVDNYLPALYIIKVGNQSYKIRKK